MKKTILTTLICSVIVVGVALAGVVVYDRFLKTDNEPNYTDSDNNPNEDSNATGESNDKLDYYKDAAETYGYGDVSKYSNIFEYFADVEIEGIKLEYATNEVKEVTEVEDIYYTDTYDLTEREIESFLNEMKSSKQQLTGGFGLPLTDEFVYITYKINGKVHTTKLLYGMWMLRESEDGNVYKIIDNNMPESDYDVLLVADSESDTLKNIVNRLNSK